MSNFLLAMAAAAQLYGAATFPNDAARWELGDLDPVSADAQTGVLTFGAVPSADVGCTAPRFTIDTRTRTVLAVHCLDADGVYRLLLTGGAQ